MFLLKSELSERQPNSPGFPMWPRFFRRQIAASRAEGQVGVFRRPDSDPTASSRASAASGDHGHLGFTLSPESAPRAASRSTAGCGIEQVARDAQPGPFGRRRRDRRWLVYTILSNIESAVAVQTNG